MAQNAVPLNDLSFFDNPSSNWKVAANGQADITQDEVLTTKDGNGILVNQPGKKGAKDLFTKTVYGDADLELDYMMAKGSNSGIYLQGRYEIQLLDSWGTVNPKSGDNGGIYERWDDSKPEGQQGYDGHAPRQNASRAPGLWQHIKISFQAPRFDGNGQKISNAKVLYVWLNGVLIQDNVELAGPTRGAFDNKEAATGPLRLQGDHGPVAFRNIRITNYDRPHPTLSNLKYWVYKGGEIAGDSYKKLKPESEGTSPVLSSNQSKLNNDFLIRYTGNIQIKEAGEYAFKLSVPGGKGVFRVGGADAVALTENRGEGKIQLQPGDHPFELLYSKNVDWAKPALGLTVAGPGIREYLLSDANVSNNDPVDPILINATSNTILRSFSDLPGGIRVTHGVNVGSPELLHYTYDLDKGMIVEIWRGGFLDATPMWHDRGDGSSRPAGSVQYLGKPVPAIEKLSDANAAWALDTVGTGYRPKGYVLNADDVPAFKYNIYGTSVTDASSVMDKGQGIHREVTLANAVDGLFYHLASGNIEALGNGLYAIDDKSYYIRIDDAAGVKAVVRDAGGKQELIIPIQKKLTYSIIF
ncbi:family 16 glycoside hydrolase [Mucilaginibacter endophyticus]|uniref:family 16 glycoside hydrolase n=1 Tax=Mucilaginibacter endophyticus TaxID=2675003 RepID=UPI001FC929CF|nr:family 16 glycoside hydrolase [Mucilaginibacter endophyticus]